jgi:hypothetical protein
VLVDLYAAYRCMLARMASMTGIGLAALGEAFECQADYEEGVQQAGQVGGGDRVPDPAGDPERPAAVQVARRLPLVMMKGPARDPRHRSIVTAMRSVRSVRLTYCRGRRGARQHGRAAFPAVMVTDPCRRGY